MNNQQNEPRALNVYKAGAGSGKTFTLSSEYIKKLVVRPNSYRNILAVTFTNKATGEMKTRILSQLYGIWKHLPDSKQYLSKISEDLSMSEEQISKMSGVALQYILHDYNHFRIETIDTFFQSVLRNIARELDLTANLRIDLNDKQVESEAVDMMIENLHNKDAILDWILSYINENVQEDKSWNVIGEIKKFGQNIFVDQYKAHYSEFETAFSSPSFFDSFRKKMIAIRKKSENDIVEIGKKFFEEAEKDGLECDDFTQKTRGVWVYFSNLNDGKFDENAPNTYVRAALLDPDSWLTASKREQKRGQYVLDLVCSKYFQMLNDAEKCRSAAMKSYFSADITLQNIYQLRLLNSIEREVRALNSDANRFLLSDTPSLLHALIKDSDAPFIFEKIGIQLDYIMIDEFQDTGIMQWQNFKVLLEECMSRSKEGNLIVGDVKQSIYRWRSGDWRLLNDITSQFSNHEERVNIKLLDSNYRSERNIIDFNNTLFQEASQYEANKLQQETDDDTYAEQLKRAYADVCQQVPPDRGNNGFVSVSLLPKEEYKERTLEIIKETIDQLLSKGLKPRNISILARRNDDIQDIADYFAKSASHIPIVSDEAFMLENSVAVNILVCALRLIVHPEDAISRAFIVKMYQKYILNHIEFTDNDILLETSKDIHSLPKAFEVNRESIKKLPLYDMVRQLSIIFELDKLNAESAYISTFYDQLTTFISENPADIESFLSEWDNTIHTEKIQTSNVDGVKIMTIHKCKGLEFDNVIVPFCDWKIDDRSLIWCSPQVEPYSSLPIIPINYSFKKLKRTIYKDDANMEIFQKRVDSLNLLYVAFTRAAHNLFIIGKRGDSSLCSKIIEDSIPNVCDKIGMQLVSGSDSDASTTLSYSYGELYVPSGQSREASRNLFLQSAEELTTSIHLYDNGAKFIQSNESRDFIEEKETDESKTYIKQGLVLHRLFSSIRTDEDIENSVRKLEFEGVLNDSGMDKQHLLSFLNKRIHSPKTADWFSHKWHLFNECSILTREMSTGLAATYRPDRVMTDGEQVVIVDFKFGHPRPEYRQQVLQYMSLIAEMGYKSIKGYLWFVYTNEIEEVYE